MNTFKRLKVGDKVEDSGYGRGVVIKKLVTRVDIKLNEQEKVWRYDIEHVNEFVRVLPHRRKHK